MNRKMTRFARGAKCGGRRAVSRTWAGAAADPLRASKSVRASPARPIPPSCSTERRPGEGGAFLFDIAEATPGDQGTTEARPGGLVPLGGRERGGEMGPNLGEEPAAASLFGGPRRSAMEPPPEPFQPVLDPCLLPQLLGQPLGLLLDERAVEQEERLVRDGGHWAAAEMAGRVDVVKGREQLVERCPVDLQVDRLPVGA